MIWTHSKARLIIHVGEVNAGEIIHISLLFGQIWDHLIGEGNNSCLYIDNVDKW